MGKKLTRILISIVFIALGIGYVIKAIMDLFEGDFKAILAIDCVLGILMFVLGIVGISKASLTVCKVLAFFVCLLAAASFVMTVFTFSIPAILGGITTTFVWALLAWIYFDMT